MGPPNLDLCLVFYKVKKTQYYLSKGEIWGKYIVVNFKQLQVGMKMECVFLTWNIILPPFHNKWNTSLFYVRAFLEKCFTYYGTEEVL